MITEDYVSFEIAKLLKEKGFPQEYDRYHSLVYNEEDYEDEYEVQRMVLETRTVKAGTLSSYPIGVPDPKCYCPTLQMAMKWLRETFEIHCQIDCPIIVSNWRYAIRDLNQDEWVTLRNMGDYETYEQACEAAIKYCLENLI